MPATRHKPAVFLDRDGVINYDSDDYVKSWAEYVFLPGALEALRQLHTAGHEVYVVTNQAGIGKGIYPERNCRDIHLRMRLAVRQAGGLISGIAVCPHRREDNCTCRKPKPGMLLTLAAKWGLDLRRSILVGDSCTDIEAARSVGCGTIFVHTRSEAMSAEHLGRCATPPDHEFANLLEAVPTILAHLAGPTEGSFARWYCSTRTPI
jgi:D-glycero-D-manno-heptose 1,7-bisphosphate phosphatase